MTGPLSLLHFAGGRPLPVIIQAEAAECGIACLAMVAAFHGHRIDLPGFRRQHAISLKGTTLKELVRLAAKLGLSCRPVRLEPADLRRLQMPAILHWNMSHFVVLKRADKSKITIHDPSYGVRHLPLDEASKHFTGVGLELTPAPGFEVKDETSRLGLTDLWQRSVGLTSGLVQALILSLVLQVFVLASPFYLQLVVDEAVVKQDLDFLVVLALGFALFMLLSVAAEGLRAYVIAYLTNMMGYQMTINLFRHLLRLPLPFFERRHIGDIVSRFTSTNAINDVIGRGLVAAVIDGLMSITTLIMIFLYSATLAWIVVVGFLLHALCRACLFWPTRDRTHELISSSARENTNFIETVRGVQSIKLFGREPEREQVWYGCLADKINANMKLQKLNITASFVETLILGLQRIVVVFVGAQLVIGGSLTIGMLFAFVSYMTLFQVRTSALIQQGVALKMLGLHLARLTDITHSEAEEELDAPVVGERQLAGTVELRNVGFRYSNSEDFVFENVCLRVEAGEMVAITGSSGCGKTTLLKIAIGLFRPTQGEVLVDACPLSRFGLRAYRSQIGVVMQDDQLFSGSLADNICFFDGSADFERIWECAQIACIHDDIMDLPMNYQSLIGDMGTILSGGQKQRVLLARALYRRPRILFMDEGTAHLDAETERKINVHLKAMSITRIVIAHRQETVAAADRVISFPEVVAPRVAALTREQTGLEAS